MPNQADSVLRFKFFSGLSTHIESTKNLGFTVTQITKLLCAILLLTPLQNPSFDPDKGKVLACGCYFCHGLC